MSLFEQSDTKEAFVSSELVEPQELAEQYDEDEPDEISLDTEAPTYKWMLEGFMPFALTLSWAKDRTYYVPWLDEDKRPRRDTTDLCYRLLLSTPTTIMHNAKFDLHVIKQPLEAFGLPLVPRRIEDTMLLSHVLNEQRSHALKSLCTDLAIEYTAGQDADSLKNQIEDYRKDHHQVHGVELGYDEVPDWLMVPYATQDAYLTLELFQRFKAELAKQMEGAPNTAADLPDIYALELKYLWVAFNMEERGMRVDLDFVYQRLSELSPLLEDIRVRMRDTLGWEMNPGSTEDVSKALKQFGLDDSAWTNPRTGRPKLPEWVIEDIVKQHADDAELVKVAQEVLEYREAQKMTSSYFEALAREHKKDEIGQAIIRCNIKTVGARTGRQSVTEPPLQTLPREKGNVRGAFIAREGHKLIRADYDQQELRVLAHFLKKAARDGKMAEILADPERDIHAETAAMIYGIDVKEAWKGTPGEKKYRKPAKDTNFAMVYGAGKDKLKAMLGAPGDEGEVLLRRYHSMFPGIRVLKRKAEQQMKSRGYIVTPFGRRHRSQGGQDYKAINSLVQGTSADLTKAACVKIENEFQRRKMEARLVLTVHDEIIAEAPDHEVEEAQAVIREQMCSFDDVLSVPLTTGMKVSDRWQAKKAA